MAHTLAETTNWDATPHRWAMGLAFATFPLIWIGGLVTSYDAGMAVPDWPSTYGYNLFLYPWSTWISGPWDLFIEHGHRLWGAVTGLCAIALVGVAWWRKRSQPVLWGLAWGALLLVIFQGFLGGMRVRWRSQALAQLHGIVGPVFFAYTLTLCAVTSRWWQTPNEVHRSGFGISTFWRGWVWILPLAAVAQLMLGSSVRHVDGLMPPTLFRFSVIGHVILGVSLGVAFPVIAILAVIGHPPAPIRRRAIALGWLALPQILVGFATWLLRYGWPSFLGSASPFSTWTATAESSSQALFATAHVAMGALILAVSTSLAICTWRLTAHTPASESCPDRLRQPRENLLATESEPAGVAG